MIIDGEKWACEACVRGHRVSSCHHSDRPLTHINKKGRPVSQCAHCRGLRKSRTTHVKCECGDKKKNSHCHKNDSDPYLDLKLDSRQRCGCTHGQRCTCALKKEHHLDTVPETGLPPCPPAALAEPLKKPQLTTTKSDSTLTVFRDGHHKPAHKHNDMAHKCGLPYTIPRSHTIHGTSDGARRSMDHLPMVQPSFLDMLPHVHRPDHTENGPQRLTKSEHDSPESIPATTGEDGATSVPPLDLSTFFPPTQPMENSNDQASEPGQVSTGFGKNSLNPIVTNVPPLDVSYSSYPASTTSPTTCVAFQDRYQEPYFASPDGDVPVGSSAFSAPPVDWSSFPIYSSDVPAATSTQTPSYASFDYNSMANGLPAPSSSGDVSEVDDFGPLTSMGHNGHDRHDRHDLNSGSEGSDMDNFRISSASSFIGLPQAQLLAASNLDSINIDDFLKSANASTAALEHQIQTSMGLETKSMPAQNAYEMLDPSPTTGLPMTSSAEPLWPAGLFEAGPTMDESNLFPPWAQ